LLSHVNTNAKKLGKDLEKFSKFLDTSLIKEILRVSLDVIGNRAVQNMVFTGNIAEAILTPVDDEKVTIRSQRLAKSMTGARLFSIIKLSALTKSQMEMILSNSKAHIPKIKAGGVNEAIREVSSSGGRFKATIGSKTPYAAAQEFGYSGKNLPARPYLEPAILQSKDDVMKLFNIGIKGEWDSRLRKSLRGDLSKLNI